MNTLFIRELKKKHALFNFLVIRQKLKKNHTRLGLDYESSIKTCEEYNSRMQEAIFSYFLLYMEKERKLSKFLNEVKKQRRQITTNCFEIINYSLDWSGTSQGHRFWHEENKKWKMHILEQFHS